MDNIPNINVVTYATHNQGYFDALKKSCKDNGNNLVILGWNTKWKGFVDKFDGMMKYLEDQNDNDISIFVDAFDVINLENSETIYEKFKKFNKPIVFSIDNPLNFFLRTEIESIVFQYDKYIINSGTYIGYNWALNKLFNEIKKYLIKTGEQDDQRIINTLYVKNKSIKDMIALDIKTDIFYVAQCKNLLSYISDSIKCDHKLLKNNEITSPLTKKKPSFIHGQANIDMDNICKALDLPKRDIKGSIPIKFYLKYIIEYFQNKLPLIICVIILICLLIIKIKKAY